MTHPSGLLPRLIGSRLYSVEFGAEHVQLRFENDDSFHMPFLSMDSLPVVGQGGRILRTLDAGYADTIRALVGQEVTAVVEDVGHGIRVEFAGTWVGLEPGADDLVADEVATLAGFTDGSTQIWRPGEGIFAGLGRPD